MEVRDDRYQARKKLYFVNVCVCLKVRAGADWADEVWGGTADVAKSIQCTTAFIKPIPLDL